MHFGVDTRAREHDRHCIVLWMAESAGVRGTLQMFVHKTRFTCEFESFLFTILAQLASSNYGKKNTERKKNDNNETGLKQLQRRIRRRKM